MSGIFSNYVGFACSGTFIGSEYNYQQVFKPDIIVICNYCKCEITDNGNCQRCGAPKPTESSITKNMNDNLA